MLEDWVCLVKTEESAEVHEGQLASEKVEVQMWRIQVLKKMREAVSGQEEDAF